MEYSTEEIRKFLLEKELKVTPQRMGILEAIYSLNNHPTADDIIRKVRKKYPHIASGTVYNVLHTFVKNNLIKKVTTDKDVIRYDGILERHHHLYCRENNLIQDYFDEELDHLLRDYFSKKKINGFQIDEVMLQIKGKCFQHKK